MLTSTLYSESSPYPKHDSASLVELFREEFCRRHGWPKEDPLEVAVDLGSRGGALNAVEKARRVMGAHLGDVRKWDELPVRHPSLIIPSEARLNRAPVDGNTTTRFEAVSFGLCLSSLERAVVRGEPAENALVRARHRVRQLRQDVQGWVSHHHPVFR